MQHKCGRNIIHMAQAFQRQPLLGSPAVVPFVVTRFTASSLALNECVRSHCKDLTLPGLPSFTAFAIRICSPLTWRLVSCQSMAFHCFALSTRAPALSAIICVLIYEDSPDSLATKHLLDVGILSPLLLLTWISDWTISHVLSASWQDGICFFQLSQCRHSYSMPCSLPAMLCTWRRNGFSTFYVINLTDNLGGTWTPTVFQFRTGTL